MSSYEQRRKLRSFLAKLLVCALIVSNIALTPVTSALAAAKAPELSSTSKNLLVGGELELSVKNKVQNSTYQWKSSDTSVATVNETGLVKGKAKGKATITCAVKTVAKTYQLSCEVTVRVPAKSIAISNKVTELKVGATYNLNRTLNPKTSNDKTYWRSSDTSIAKVYTNGKVRAVKKGTVTITATTLSGKKDTVKIKIVSDKIEKTVTAKDLKNGVVKLSNATYDILTIDSSVGNAEVILDHIKVKDTLYMEADAAYTVIADDSDINKVVALETSSKIVSMAVETKKTAAPTFVAGKGTLVVTVDARGNVSVKQEGEAKIGTVSVNRSIGGSISLSLEGFEGNLVVNTTSNADIGITTKNCAIEETTISGTSSGQKLTLTDDTTNGASSNLGKINVETSAKLSIDVPAKEVVITQKASNALVTLEKPVERVVNGGTSTKLNINNTVGSVESAGNDLTMKVAAGSTITKVELTGKSSSVDVALGSKIESVVAKGDNTAISGSGSVVSATVEGNNANITTADTKVAVGANATGTQVNGSQVSAGTTTTPAPTTGGTPGGSTTPSTPSTPSTPTTQPTPTPTTQPTQPTPTPITQPTQPTPTPTTQPTQPTPTPTTPAAKITISNPGDVFCGTSVTMVADSSDVTWSVYGYIDDSQGNAYIDETTGQLDPISAGTVRVVAVSKTNNNSYGAVDLVIQGKKFVKMLPIDDINLSSDEALASIPELEASGKLPTQVTLVYETGVGNETENIDVTLPANYWFGEYQGIQTGTYLIERYITVPNGYERPTDLYAEVLIHVNVPQTDQRLYVTGLTDYSPINLSTDEHCVKINSVYSKYFSNLPVTLQLSDGSTRPANVTGMYVDSANQFNGAVPGVYNVDLAVDLPAGLNYRNVYNLSATYAFWYDDDTFRITVPINVTTAQTPENYSDTTAPATTQTKITPVMTAATIQSVVLTGMPASVNYGDVLDLNQYVAVNTTSTMPSDQRVLWSIDGASNWNGFASISGRGIMNRSGSHIIRATSIVDASKYSEVTVSVSGAAVTGFVPFNPVNVTEDKGIVNFKTLFNGLKTQLPSTITANTVSGSSIVAIRGWTLQAATAGAYTLKPTVDTGLAYDYNQLPELQVNLSVPQSDNRTVVTALQPVQSSITIEEDKYATTDEYLINALFGNSSVITVPVIATLQNGGTLPVGCSISNKYIQCSNSYLIYQGLPGDYILHLTLNLPDELKGLTSDTMDIQIPITLTVAQTARYNALWVSQNPTKMTYTDGEMFDFSGIILMLRNTTVVEDANYTFISSDQLSNYNLRFYIYDNNGAEVDITNTALTKELNNRYIHVRNLTNSSYTFFGPITVTD